MRIAITAALEALEAGDQAHAADVLLAALEGESVVDPAGRRRRCPHCAAGPFWSEPLADHVARVHAPRPARGMIRSRPGGRR